MPKLIIHAIGSKVSWNCSTCGTAFAENLNDCPVCKMRRESDIWLAKFNELNKVVARLKKEKQSGKS